MREPVTVDQGSLVAGTVNDVFADYCYHWRYYALASFLERDLRTLLNSDEVRSGLVTVTYGKALDTFGTYYHLILKAYFGMEVGLKLLLTRGRRHKESAPRTHDYRDLYNALPDRFQKDLARQCRGQGFELEEFLAEHVGLYVDFRYLERSVVTPYMVVNAYYVLRFCLGMQGRTMQCTCVNQG